MNDIHSGTTILPLKLNRFPLPESPVPGKTGVP